MKMVDTACEYYKQGRQLALMINNDFMVKKFENILTKISDTKRKWTLFKKPIIFYDYTYL